MSKLTNLFAPASIAMACGFALLFAYWSVLLIQQEGAVEHGVSIVVEGGIDNVDLVADLTAIANKHHGRVAVAMPQPSGLDVYASGDIGDKTYRLLPPASAVTVHDLAELPFGEARWHYQFSQGRAFEQEINNYLSENGVLFDRLSDQPFGFLIAGTPLGSMLLLVLIVCCGTVLASTLVRSRDYAIWQVYGLGLAESALKESKRSYRLPALLGIAALIAASVFVGLTTSWHSAGVLLNFAARYLAAFLCLMALGFIASLIAVRRLPIPERLKGKLPAVATPGLALAMQAAAVISIASFAIPAFNTAPRYLEQEMYAPDWERTSDVIVASLSGARDDEGIQESKQNLAQVIREFSSRHQVVYAEYEDENVGLSYGLHTPAVMFNHTAAARSITPPLEPADHPVLYVPGSVTVATSTLKESYEGCDDHCEVRMLEPGHEVFTWDVSETGWMEPAVVTDPIIMVYPDDQLPSDQAIVSAMSRMRLGFTTDEFLHRVAEDKDLASFIIGSQSMATVWAEAQGTLGQNALLFTGGLVMAVAFTFALAVVTAFIYRRLWHQRLTVTYAFGRYPTGVYARTAVIGALTLTALGVFLWNRAAIFREWASLPPGAASPSMLAEARISPEAVSLSVAAAVIAYVIILAVVTRQPRVAVKVGSERQGHGADSARD